MANLMGITNPVPAYDSSANNHRQDQANIKPNDTRVQNIVDPTRVVRSDDRTEQQAAKDMQNMALRYNSNLQSFIEQLKNSPDMAKELARMMTQMQNVVSTPGMAQGVTSELEAFLKMVQMNDKQFRDFFMTQMKTGNRFGGPLFDMLRNLLSSNSSENVQNSILNFAKRFSDFSSSKHIESELTRILAQIKDYIPASYHQKLDEMAAKLQAGIDSGDRAASLDVLKGEVLPYLSNYVERTNDMGHSRTMLSMLMLNIARYENGDNDALIQAFRQLSSFSTSLAELNKFDNTALMHLFNGTNFQQAVGDDVYSKNFAQIAQQAMNGNLGTEMREIFTEITRAMLLNESVYMTLNHTMIPMNYNGKMMFSEMWVDPNGKNNKGNEPFGKDDKNTIRFLFKLDIEKLGYVEITLAANKENVYIDVMGPNDIADNSDVISEDISNILADYGFNKQGVNVKELKKPLAITEVFPDLFKGGHNVNVKI